MGGAHEDEEESVEDIIEEERVLLTNVPLRFNIFYKCMTPRRFMKKFDQLLEQKDIDAGNCVLA